MKTLLFILICVVAVCIMVWILPYAIAIPVGLAKALWLILTGRENDPEWKERLQSKKEAGMRRKTLRKTRFQQWFGLR